MRRLSDRLTPMYLLYSWDLCETENRRLIAYVPLYPQNPLQPSYSAKGKADGGEARLRIYDKINNHIFKI